MLSIFRRATNGSSLCTTRLFSTSTRLRSFGAPSRPVRATKYIQLLRKETHNSIWPLVENLNTPQRLPLSDALSKHGISTHEFNRWKPALYQSNIADAASILARDGFVMKESDLDSSPQKTHPPPWLVLYLACSKVRTPAHAHGPMMDLVLSNLDASPPDIQGPLLILSMLNLARFNLLLPMRRITNTFLTTPLSNPALEFNLLLQAISTSLPAPSIETGNQIVSILKTMEARQLRLRSDTYKALLRDRFVTLQLTRYLRERMVQEGFVPEAAHLEAYLKVFAKNGLIHDAKQYFDAVRAEAIRTKSPVPISPDDVPPDEQIGVPHPATISLLGAQGDRASAFQYLVKLVNTEKVHELDDPANNNTTTTNPNLSRLVLRSSPRPRSQPRLPWKHSIDIFDWTTAFAVAANDTTTSAEALIRIFERVHAKHMAFRPTVATYTVLIRGLFRRRKYADAERYWHTLLHSGLALDAHALSIGLQTLTRAGKPHEALHALETFAARTNAPFPAAHTPHRPIDISPMDINLLMVALIRIERPDIVFKLWDHMADLYNVRPNTISLSILLQAVRVANRLDDSFAGAVAHLALRNPFRRPPPPPKSREEILKAFEDVVGDVEGGVKPYVSGIWADAPPLERARKIFQQVMFGEAPTLLPTIRAPAHAVREDTDTFHPLTELTQGLGLPNTAPSKPPEFHPPPDVLTPQGTSHHPQIVPTNANCFDYLTLLGTSGRASEIPLVLAWMRALRIQPSRATLAVALIFWAEVGVRAPLIEEWGGGRGGGEYGRLVEWVRGWVGEGRMPRGGDFGKWVGVVRRMRDVPR